jgi:hypothetical protein
MVYNRLANLRKGSGLNAEPNRSEAQAAVEAVGGLFQVPCVAPRGSMILFLSTTLHSARFMPDPDQVTHDAHDPYADDDDDDDPDVHSAFADSAAAGIAIGDSWRGWRCVVFVAFRPKAGVSEAHIHDLLVAFQQNRITRHGGSLFPKKPWDCYAKASTSTCTPRVREIFESIVERCEMPVATLRQELDDVVESTLGLQRLTRPTKTFISNASQTSRKHKIAWHDCYTLRVQRTVLRVLKQGHEVGFSGFLQCVQSHCLKSDVGEDKVASNFPDKALKRQLPDEELGGGLVLPDFTKGHRPRTKAALDLLHAGTRRVHKAFAQPALAWKQALPSHAHIFVPFGNLLRAHHFFCKKCAKELFFFCFGQCIFFGVQNPEPKTKNPCTI